MALAFAIEGTSPLSQPSTYNASNYSIALTAATSCYLDSLVMQHTPTQRYPDSSDCEKRGCLLVTVIQFTRLPSDSLCLCLRTGFAFILIMPLPSNSRCLRKVFAFAIAGRLHWRAFVIERPLASKYTCLCHRRAFAPLKGLCFQSALGFATEGTLPSKGLGHARKDFAHAFEGLLPLPLKSLCHRRANIAFERPWDLCHRRAFCFKVPLPLPPKCLLLEANAPHAYNASNYSIIDSSYIDSLVIQHAATQP